jgi:hypothetical protein
MALRRRIRGDGLSSLLGGKESFPSRLHFFPANHCDRAAIWIDEHQRARERHVELGVLREIGVVVAGIGRLVAITRNDRRLASCGLAAAYVSSCPWSGNSRRARHECALLWMNRPGSGTRPPRSPIRATHAETSTGCRPWKKHRGMEPIPNRPPGRTHPSSAISLLSSCHWLSRGSL